MRLNHTIETDIGLIYVECSYHRGAPPYRFPGAPGLGAAVTIHEAVLIGPEGALTKLPDFVCRTLERGDHYEGLFDYASDDQEFAVAAYIQI